DQIRSYEQEKRHAVESGLVSGPPLRLQPGMLQAQERMFDPLLGRYRDNSTEASQRHMEERERVAHLNRAKDIQILREQPFDILNQESKLEKLAPGKDPARLGGHGTIGTKERTKDGRGHFPQTAVDYNILSNMPFQEHHWAKPEPRVSQFGEVPEGEEGLECCSVATASLRTADVESKMAGLKDDFDIINNRYLDNHSEKLRQEKHVNLLEAPFWFSAPKLGCSKPPSAMAVQKERPSFEETFGPLAEFSSRKCRIFALAWPSILSELSTPFLGLVDTMVVGHFNEARDVASLALALAAYNPLLLAGNPRNIGFAESAGAQKVFNFLRMGFGGVTAQAYGAKDSQELAAGALRGLAVGCVLGSLLCLLRGPLAQLLFGFLHVPDEATLDRALAYFQTRVYGTPAALSNFVVQAWLINIQRTDVALATNLVLNLCNAFLCILLGCLLDYGIEGVATATVISNYVALAFGCYQIWWNLQRLPWLAEGSQHIQLEASAVFSSRKLAKLATLNVNILVRSVCMMVIVTDFTSLSGKLGSAALAGNNLLMQLQMLISFGADGFANAGEAMVGQAIGLGDSHRVRQVFGALMCWGLLLGLAFTALYITCGRQILFTLTSHPEIVAYAEAYLPWQWCAPLLSFTAYLMDGLFVGATQPSKMRDATFLALLVFWLVSHAQSSLSNDVLWGAFMLHLLVRAAVLLYWYRGIEVAADERHSYYQSLLPSSSTCTS
ncbi:dinF, partial [Symbiodinium sp. KB8]